MFLHGGVEELLRQFELFEVFTDHTNESHYAAAQKNLTGYNANPTYLVLDSKSQLEVARESYTTDQERFERFLRKGLEDIPAFRSWIRFEDLSYVENDLEVVKLEPDGSLDFDPGEVFRIRDRDERTYRGDFQARQRFRVPKGLAPGDYRVRAKLITAVYEERKWVETLSRTAIVDFTILNGS